MTKYSRDLQKINFQKFNAIITDTNYSLDKVNGHHPNRGLEKKKNNSTI